MLSETVLDIGFKGLRTYLHSTDIYDCCTRLLRESSADGSWVCSMRFHRMVSSQVRIVSGQVPGAPVTLGVRLGDRTHDWSIVDGCGDVCERYPYDEDSLVAPATLGPTGISMKGSTCRSGIEELVALTKRLHQHAFPDAAGRWVVASLDFDRCLHLSRPEFPRVELVRTLGRALTECVMYDGATRIGQIRFALQVTTDPR